MRILVTGSNGFIGRRLTEMLAECNHEVLRATRSREGFIDTVELHDESSEEDLRVVMVGVDCIIHLAAMVHTVIKPSPEVKAAYERTNVEWVKRLASAARQLHVKRFVFVSSIGVLGNDSTEKPYTEEMVSSPENLYTISKWKAEQLLQQLGQDSELEIVIVRPTLVYGEAVKANFLSLLKALDYRIPLPLGSLANRRSFLYVGNLASALMACASHPNASGQTFNVCDGNSMSPPSLLRELANMMDKHPFIFPCPTWFLECLGRFTNQQQRVNSLTKNLEVDSSKIRRELDWHPPYSTEEGMAKTVAWFLAQKRNANRS